MAGRADESRRLISTLLALNREVRRFRNPAIAPRQSEKGTVGTACSAFSKGNGLSIQQVIHPRDYKFIAVDSIEIKRQRGSDGFACGILEYGSNAG
jgi:hypothetical protein